jgi:hypothetical protein
MVNGYKKNKRKKELEKQQQVEGSPASTQQGNKMKQKRKKHHNGSWTNKTTPEPETIQQHDDPLNHPYILISEIDHDSTLKLLQSMDWTMAKNTSRRNVIREDDRSTPRNDMGKPYCMSFIFGRNMKDPSGRLSYWSEKYPHVYRELQALMHKYDPSFQYTHITLNYNLRCKRHTDGGNLGPSYIAAFGNFKGGELIVEQQENVGAGKDSVVDTCDLPLTPHVDKRTTTIDRYLDLKSRFVKFNGKTQPHETAPFCGERYTLVYYTSDIVPPTVDRRASSSTVMKGLATSKASLDSAVNPQSAVAKQFEAIKAKLGQRKKRR